jgi:hypothetical protein
MKFRIKPGASFRDSDDSIKTGGQTIELPPDMAAQHADKVEPLDEEAAALEAAATE